MPRTLRWDELSGAFGSLTTMLVAITESGCWRSTIASSLVIVCLATLSCASSRLAATNARHGELATIVAIFPQHTGLVVVLQGIWTALNCISRARR